MFTSIGSSVIQLFAAHQAIGSLRTADLSNCSDPLFYPAIPPAHWSMVAEIEGRVLVVPLAPSLCPARGIDLSRGRGDVDLVDLVLLTPRWPGADVEAVEPGVLDETTELIGRVVGHDDTLMAAPPPAVAPLGAATGVRGYKQLPSGPNDAAKFSKRARQRATRHVVERVPAHGRVATSARERQMLHVPTHKCGRGTAPVRAHEHLEGDIDRDRRTLPGGNERAHLPRATTDVENGPPLRTPLDEACKERTVEVVPLELVAEPGRVVLDYGRIRVRDGGQVEVHTS